MTRLHARVAIDAEKLRAVRIARGMTQQELSERTGLSFPAVSRIENGHVRAVLSITKQALEKVLGADFTPGTPGEQRSAEAR